MHLIFGTQIYLGHRYMMVHVVKLMPVCCKFLTQDA